MNERYCIASCFEEDYEKCLGEIIEKIDACNKKPILLLFFTGKYFKEFSVDLHKKYADSEVIGSSTPFIFGSVGADGKGIYCLAIYEGIECTGGVIPEAAKYPMKYVGNVEKALEGISEYKNTVCMEFTTNTSFSEELVLDTLNSVLAPKKIRVFGASSGADSAYSETYVSLNGEVFDNGAVFVLIRNLHGRIYLYKENMYKSTNIMLRATDVECESRMVYEFNEKPAMSLLRNDLGIPKSMLISFMDEHPLGRVIDKDIFIVSARDIIDDGIQFHGRIYNMMPMVLLEMENLDTVWSRTARNIKDIAGIRPSFTIAVNCMARKNIFEKYNVLDKFYDKLSSEYGDYIGITGFGEQLDNVHLNQTLVLALFE